VDHDILGRPVSRTENEGTTTWTYDDATGKGLGLLHSVSGPDGGGGTYSESYTYDADFSRVVSVEKAINGQTFTTLLSYDGASRTGAVTHQVAGFADQTLRHLYNSYGTLSEVRDMSVPGGPAQGTTLWSLGSVSVYGQPVDETFGNGVTAWTSYRATDGMIEKRQVSTGGTYLENLKLGLDLFGNVHRRELYNDAAQGALVRAEDYGIDLLDRLTSVKLNGTTSLSLTYDVRGNITNKSDVGNYSYSGIGAGPHAVTQAGTTTYGYDANGNLTQRNGVTENVWTSFDQPQSITRGSASSSFLYGASRERIQQINSAGETIRYVGAGLEHVTKGSLVTCRHAVFTPGGRVAEISVGSDGTRTTNYFASDHLGSVEAVTDAQGNVLEQLSYNAWGQRRNADWTPGKPARSTNVNRGYTDHEMLDWVGLVHMNGRVYDPVLARFLRADPVVSDPLSAQTYNGYSYVGNNPTSATDPSGYDAVQPLAMDLGNNFYVFTGNGGYNLNTSNFGSNGFSLFGGAVNFSIGESDPFNSRWGPAYPIGPLMQAQYTSMFGAPSIFRGGQTVADGNSYIRSAGSSAKGDSTIRTVYGPLTGQNLVRLLGFDGMIWEDIRNSPLTQKEAARILMVLGHRIPETHEIFAAKLAIYQFYSPRGALAIKGTIAGGMWLATTLDTAIQVGTGLKKPISTGSFVSEATAAKNASGRSTVTSLAKYYPENNGFIGATERKFLMPGDVIDRFGGSGYSRFFSPQGVTEAGRALPPGTAGQSLRLFKVLKPFEVEAGTVAPAFGEMGFGTQYLSPVRLEFLLKRGFLIELPK